MDWPRTEFGVTSKRRWFFIYYRSASKDIRTGTQSALWNRNCCYRNNPSGVEVINYKHQGDEWEKKIENFKKAVLIEIQNSFNLELDSYDKKGFYQLSYIANDEGKLTSLYKIVTEINREIKDEVGVGYVNVVGPISFIKDNHGYVLFKKADGTNYVYTLSKKNDVWKIVNKESKPGKVMPKELLWYMVFKQS
jgi:hypothetical protein